MSLENAILELAASIKLHAASLAEMAAANTKLAQNDDAKLEAYKASLVDYSEGLLAGGFKVDTSEADKAKEDADLEQAVEKVEAAARGTTRKEAADNQASIEAERAAAADPKPVASGVAESAGTSAGAEPLSYEKDVKPVLIALAGKCGKQALTDLIASFGVPKADKLNAEQLVAAKAQAEALIAG